MGKERNKWDTGGGGQRRKKRNQEVLEEGAGCREKDEIKGWEFC